MATLEQIADTYDYLDELFRLLLGETADITCALYNGDFSKTLGQAQHDKHQYVLDAIRCGPDSRVLDIGCGWGPILRAATARGARAVGLTLSPKQAQACSRNGLDVRLLDWKDSAVDTLGRFDGIVSIGAFEHFCSVEEYLAGRQDAIYEDFFRLCDRLLPQGGRLYLQTMMWGQRVPKYENISLHAPRGSDEYILAVLEKFYPGSWLPTGEQQIIRDAGPYFKVISLNNGRRDYIETMTQWGKSRRITPQVALLALRMLPRAIRDRSFRYKLQSLRSGYNKECFRRQIMDHQRMVFEKV